MSLLPISDVGLQIKTFEVKIKATRLGVDKVKPKGWFKFFLTDKYFLLSVHFCGTPPSWLKVIGGLGG